MSSPAWYWHRLRAMEPGEIVAHARKKLYRWQDARRLPDWSGSPLDSASPRGFPNIPNPDDAPVALREALASDAKGILAGRWKAFCHLELQVDDPPQWHKDHLAGRNLATQEIAFKLDHRELPDGADIKLIWELSRWHPLVRLAMAAHVLADDRAAAKCVGWLEDWVKHNPPYRGWNWTSALEVGMRLVQFTWIDALLQAQAAVCGYSGRLAQLRREILPAHVRFAWRYRSFGSSANNHLVGELTGLILALARWPELSHWATSLDELQTLLVREVLAQFAEDGGNREQALNYHWFSWEFCWQARAALVSAGKKISAEMDERLRRAARFFWEVQVRREPWDYGDSDNAFVTPFFAREKTALSEWRDWLSGSTSNLGASLAFWLGDPPVFSPPLGRARPAYARIVGDWWFYPDTGMAICESGFWFLRWDLSSLGYLKTAAHGHLDALHLSIWVKGVAMVVDPGTGAYYADRQLRDWLASGEAHNTPLPKDGIGLRRLGPFLWSGHHLQPDVVVQKEQVRSSWRTSERTAVDRTLQRAIEPARGGWEITDSIVNAENTEPRGGFSVRWQFAPDAIIKRGDSRRFVVSRQNIEIEVRLSEDWTEVKLVEVPADREKLEPENSMAGLVSPAFRKTVFAPYLLLTAQPRSDKPCVFRTTFLASPDS
ncbi:MAG TPA: heparinase II/III family protein [Candidatus Angelobacter sp.]|nr:heparinase II/III family protein [Candidatus Angelobacter sp.]